MVAVAVEKPELIVDCRVGYLNYVCPSLLPFSIIFPLDKGTISFISSMDEDYLQEFFQL